MRVVIDTNVLVASVSRRSSYRLILDRPSEKEFDLYVTTDILLEYDELLARFYGAEVADLTLRGITMSSNVFKIETYFNLQLISADQDDNKFVDCAFASNAHYLVTNDRDYNVLKSLEFPKINLLKANEFMALF